MSGFAVKAVIVLIAIALICVLVARFFRRVTPAKAVLRRQRMPLLVVVAGAVLLVAGFVLSLAAFTSRYTEQLLPARIASVVLVVVGIAVLVAYRNWFLEVGSDAVRFRTILGQDRRIAYRDIVSRRTIAVFGRARVVVRSADGQKLSVDAARYDVSAVIAATAPNR